MTLKVNSSTCANLIKEIEDKKYNIIISYD